MEITELIGGVRDSLTAKRVYGEPFEQNGLTIIPAASVRGGGGGGGESPEGGGGGSGGGFGLAARPTGAWVIADGQVEWKPAVDVMRIAFMRTVVLLTGLLVIRGIAQASNRRTARRVEIAKLVPQRRRRRFPGRR